MKKIISIICVAGFFVCLLLMYTTDLGVNGLRKHDADFEMLDMSFHYTADDVNEAFEGLGEDGIAAYHKFWILDYAFIACFLVVMLAIPKKGDDLTEITESLQNPEGISQSTNIIAAMYIINRSVIYYTKDTNYR